MKSRFIIHPLSLHYHFSGFISQIIRTPPRPMFHFHAIILQSPIPSRLQLSFHTRRISYLKWSRESLLLRPDFQFIRFFSHAVIRFILSLARRGVRFCDKGKRKKMMGWGEKWSFFRGSFDEIMPTQRIPPDG